ncbi:MAG: hypothetical protein WC050_01585 [Candidatus Paceibacterota bacterium]
MSQPPTRVAFVAAGTAASPGRYVSQAETYAQQLNDKLQSASDGDEEPRKAFEAAVFTTIDEALVYLSVHSPGTKTLAFVSATLIDEADKIKKKNPKLNVVLFSGAQSTKKAEVISKKWITPDTVAMFVS